MKGGREGGQRERRRREILCVFLWYSQGAPEGILERCSFVRVNGQDKIAMTPEIKAQILQVVKKYGTGT